MSDEMNNKPAAETAAEQTTAPEAQENAQEKPAQGKATKGKKVSEAEAVERLKAARAKAKEANGALRAVGLDACKRHGLKCVWVTDDGQCFDQESNARAHGKNLENSEPLKVEA